MKKVYLNGLKAVAGKVGSRLFRLLLISIEFNLKTRLMALILMTALLMPLSPQSLTRWRQCRTLITVSVC